MNAPIYQENTSSFIDLRGEIWTTYKSSMELDTVCHVKINTNSRGVFRGFHRDPKTTKLSACISGEILSFVVWPCNTKYKIYELSSAKHSSLIIPPNFYNGFLSLTESIYIYHLSYTGQYVDASDQSTLTLEDSCIPLQKIDEFYPYASIIRSSRDI